MQHILNQLDLSSICKGRQQKALSGLPWRTTHTSCSDEVRVSKWGNLVGLHVAHSLNRFLTFRSCLSRHVVVPHAYGASGWIFLCRFHYYYDYYYAYDYESGSPNASHLTLTRARGKLCRAKQRRVKSSQFVANVCVIYLHESAIKDPTVYRPFLVLAQTALSYVLARISQCWSTTLLYLECGAGCGPVTFTPQRLAVARVCVRSALWIFTHDGRAKRSLLELQNISTVGPRCGL